MSDNKRQRKDGDNAGSTSLRLFDDFLHDIGRSRSTGRRWRKAGMIETINIEGKVYVTLTAIGEFEARAAKGDFAKATSSNVPGFASRNKQENHRELRNVRSDYGKQGKQKKPR